MKKTLLFLFTLSAFYVSQAQYLINDSLQGFDLAKTVLEGHQKNFEHGELKLYVDIAKKNFIINKYNLYQNIPPANAVSKYSSNTTANSPCFNEDFENYPIGPFSSAGFNFWTAQQSTSYSSLCSSTTASMPNNNSGTFVYATPVSDPNIGTVGTSPFGGNQIIKINGPFMFMSRIKQTFPVISTNWLFNYAYMGVLSPFVHGCCDDTYLMFRFLDCLGNPISSLSQTVVMGTPSCVTTSTTNWAFNSIGMAYTPNWQIVSVNLSAYTGTCLTIEASASSCYTGAHTGYMYFDALCSAGDAMIINERVYQSPASSYTSCISQTTLSALPGFSSYQWQGPPTGTVSGATSSVITTSVNGNYTLTATLGTITTTQVLNLSIVPGLSINILGNTNVCAGESSTLQASGSGAITYSWSTNSNLQTISISPTSTAVYSVVASNTAGCLSSDSKTVSLLPNPVIGINSTPPSICAGQNSTLDAVPPTNSFTWSNGTSGASAIVSPSVSSNYTVTSTNSVGCVRSLSLSVTVFPSPQLSVSLSSPFLCLGQSMTMLASGLSGNTYSWSTGSTTSSITVSPTTTSLYTVTATTSLNCTNSNSFSITVYPLPQIQLIGSSNEICVGETVNIGVLGSNIGSFLWNTGASTASITVSPTLPSVYSVSVSSAVGCTSEQSISIAVNPLPQIQITASSASICSGESATLAVNNASVVSYVWSGNQITSSIVVSPTVSTQYSVVVSDAKGCMANSNFQLKVFSCADTLSHVGLDETPFDKQKLIIFPNPSDGSFEIRGYKAESGTLISELGQILSEFYLTNENHYTFKISNLAKGIYFVKGDSGAAVKIIVR